MVIIKNISQNGLEFKLKWRYLGSKIISYPNNNKSSLSKESSEFKKAMIKWWSPYFTLVITITMSTFVIRYPFPNHCYEIKRNIETNF